PIHRHSQDCLRPGCRSWKLPIAQANHADAIGPLMRLGAIFVAICMVIIAVSAGAAIYFYFGVGVSEAATVTIATLTALAIYNAISTRIGVDRPPARRSCPRHRRPRA